MAEYYPLLAKAVGSLPNSTPETRRIVYERARKALIGQLKTLHPPVPEEDIERESVALDRAIERLETELAAASPVAPPAPPGTTANPPPAEQRPASPSVVAPAPPRAAAPAPSGALGPLAARKPIAPLRPRMPKPATSSIVAAPATAAPAAEAAPPVAPPPDASADAEAAVTAARPAEPPLVEAAAEPTETKPRLEAQRPIAPQPPTPQTPKRRMWIIPAALAAVVLLVAFAAWKLRVKPETVAHKTPPAATQQQPENGKIAERVGGTGTPNDQGSTTQNTPSSEAPAPPSAPNPQAAAPAPTSQQPAPQATNPELPVAYRAALLVEAPDLPSKVQTFPGTVVWKLNNVNSGPSDTVGLSVEADIDLPDDKTKAVVTFEKNTDPSLPASHTIKVRFMVDPGSYSGDVKQISVPQMRREGNSDGEPLAGVTVPVIQNSFLVGLSPGNAETANLRLLGELPWIDIPMLLSNGKIAKLTFEKGAAGQRDISEALAYWQKQ